MMAFPTHAFPAGLPLFPPRDAVLDYLRAYAADLRDMIAFNERVVAVSHAPPSTATPTADAAGNGRAGKWTVWLESGVRQQYDAVVVANGHYSIPHIPDYPGLRAAATSWPPSPSPPPPAQGLGQRGVEEEGKGGGDGDGGRRQGRRGCMIEHARNFRSPQAYAGKRVLVVGNYVSANDIARQLLPYVSLPLFQSARSTASFPAWPAGQVVVLPAIERFLAEPGHLRFADGSELSGGVDVILFATGYLYSFPFLSRAPDGSREGEGEGEGEGAGAGAGGGERATGTWQHLFSASNPTLAFIGLPTRVIPFPLAQSQAAVVARVWSGRVQLPPPDEMRAWEHTRLEAVSHRARGFHILGWPLDADYMDFLETLADSAGRGGGIEPARWRGRERWMRSLVPQIRARVNDALGRGEAVETLEHVGLVYDGGREVNGLS